MVRGVSIGLAAFVLGVLVGGWLKPSGVEAAPSADKPYQIVVQEWCAVQDETIEFKMITLEDLTDD